MLPVPEERPNAERRILALFALTLGALIEIAALQYRSVHRLNEDSRWVLHTLSVLEELEATLTSLTSAEIAARNFIVGGDSHYLDSRQSIISTRDHTRRVRTLTADSPQQRKLDRLKTLVDRRIQARQPPAFGPQVPGPEGAPARLQVLGRTALRREPEGPAVKL